MSAARSAPSGAPPEDREGPEGLKDREGLDGPEGAPAAAVTTRAPRAARPKPDPACVEAVEPARAAAVDLVGAEVVGEHLGYAVEAERVVTHAFACLLPGYAGWRWAVVVARAARAKIVTVDEVVLLPGPGALLAPPWVPWSQRVQPGDLGPGDLLPTAPDDPRLVPGWTGADADPEAEAEPDLLAELGLRRARVLSAEGREFAAQRWYEGPPGPDAVVAQGAPAPCSTCGFLVPLAGALGHAFGVCANDMAPDDGRVVAFDHGCGAHSEAHLGEPVAAPEPVHDTVADELVVAARAPAAPGPVGRADAAGTPPESETPAPAEPTGVEDLGHS